MFELNRKFVVSPRAYESFIEKFLEHSSDSCPRGLATKEILNATIVVTNPVDRIITNKGRKMNIAFAIAEWFSIVYGIDKIDFFTQFIQDYSKFSTDGFSLDGAYGTRLIYTSPVEGTMVGRNQIEAVIDTLQKDKESRRAVISIYSSEDLFGRGGTNTPCTLSLQFLIRDNELHAVINMRSSDIIRGVTYDLFVFTMIQEYIARQLGVNVGQYIHNAGSLHFYETDRRMYNSMGGSRWPLKMQEMPKLSAADMLRFHDLVYNYLNHSRFFFETEHWPDTLQSTYLLDMAFVMKAFIERKKSALYCRTAYQSINDTTLRHMIKQWITV